jgi:ribonuclease III
MRNLEKIESFIKNISQFEEKISYSFKNLSNLFIALTHSSYANENKEEKLKSNERLEFLGDAVLNIVITEKIFTNYSGLAEGELTKMRASIVCEPSLMKCANQIEIGKYLLLGKGEELSGGRIRASILSDAMEALIGAIYLDGGLKNAKRFVYDVMSKTVEESSNGMIFMDYKSQLQELIQKKSDEKITYQIIEEKGPDHNKIFVSQLKIDETVFGVGEGKTKKEAEQNAAKEALKKIGG